MYSDTYTDGAIKKNKSIRNISDSQLYIQIGISLWIIFLVHISHVISFGGVIFPVIIDRASVFCYYTMDLLNIAIPLYLFSHGWRLEKYKVLSFQYYLRYHLKFLIPGLIYIILIFVVKSVDKIEPIAQNNIPLPDDDWSWSVPYRLGLMTVFIYHFIVAIVMYPMVCLIKKNCEYIDNYDEFGYGIVSSSDLFTKLDKDISKNLDINHSNNIDNSSNSNLPFIITNILIYFFIINIFYYFSLGSYLYIIYTCFYSGIFLTYSWRFIQKEISICGVCAFMNIINISLFAYFTSDISSSAFNHGTVFFTTFFLFLVYYFTGFTMAFSDSISRLQEYYLDILLLIPILYNIISIPSRKFMFSPLTFPISFRNSESYKTIISSWIGMIFIISIAFRFFGELSIDRIKKFLIKTPFVLTILTTAILFIYERAAQITIEM
ncbi:putative membrane associated protein [Cryptosporidium canis]|uniref:Membrane associated protein n=1 Tax=Cryptosporidium canis TaxID=195482 RepID=A0ABQ8P949_9CRYT|nr:putative membrane associated protein [Cryptosporidium canis]KAJ1613210.1 putative membrane associated protein [Cryptosporidium canis]